MKLCGILDTLKKCTVKGNDLVSGLQSQHKDYFDTAPVYHHRYYTHFDSDNGIRGVIT